jgi:hypothetical protein
MKIKFYLLIFAGIIAISLAVFSILTVNPQAETWSSIALGGVLGLIIVKLPAIIAMFKKKTQAR